MVFVELDDVFQSPYWSTRHESSEIGVEISFQFVHENSGFGVVELSVSLQIGWIDQCGALLLDHIESLFHERVHGVADPEILAGDPDASAFQAVGIAKLCVIRLRLAGTGPRRRIVRINSRQST